MVIISGSVTGCAGLIHCKLHLKIQNHNRSRPVDYNVIRVVSEKIRRGKIQCFVAAGFRGRYAAYAGRNQHEFSHNNDFVEEPFWLTLIKEASGALKSLFMFLLDQPSQLKFIEWPSFQSTLKTALLTLILVGILIVALASVDSALGYLLALLLRKPA